MAAAGRVASGRGGRRGQRARRRQRLVRRGRAGLRSPSGVFDADWVAGIVVDREGRGFADRVELARAAQLAWDARGRGAGAAEEATAVLAGGFDAPTAAAVCRAVEDYVSAYGS